MPEARRKAILLVEDEVLIAMTERRVLERFGYEVLTAATGEVAVELVASEPHLDLVLMDLDLGQGMDGTETARRILELRDLPLVFLSSHMEQTIVEKTEGITSYGYIVKNSGTTILQASIKMAFRLFDARSELRSREVHYRSLFESALGPVWVEDFSAFKLRVDELRKEGFGDFRAWLADHPEELFGFADLVAIVDMNREALRAIGLESKEGMPRTLRPFLGPEARDYFQEELSVLAEGRQSFRTEIVDTVGDEDPKTYLLGLQVVTGHEGDLARVYVSLDDLSGLRRAEQALQTQSRLQRLLVDISTTWINLSPALVASTVEASLADIARAVSADRAYIFDYDFERGVAVVSTCWLAEGIASRFETGQVLALSSIAEAVAVHSRGEPHWVGDIYALPPGPVRQTLEAVGIRSSITVPMTSGTRCVGSVGFDSVRKHHAYPESERGLLRVFAGMLVNVEQRRLAEGELARNRAELRAIYDSNPVMMCVVDEERRVLFANPAFTDFTGASEDELRQGKACGVFGCVNALDDPRGCGFGKNCGGCTMRNAMLETLATGRAHRNVEYDADFERDGVRREVFLLGSTALMEAQGRRRLLICLLDITDRRRAEERIKALLDEKGMLVKETYHRVKNNMQVVNSLLSLEANAQPDGATRDIIHSAADRLRSMMVLHERLYRSDGAGELGTRDFLLPLIAEIVGPSNGTGGVKAEVDMEDFDLSADCLVPVGIIINELVTNSMKYAFGDRGAGTVAVSMTKRNDSVTLSYSDDGVGMPEKATSRTGGFGMQLVAALVSQIHGVMTIDRNKGTRFVIEFEDRKAGSSEA